MEEKGIAPTLYKAEIPENKELLDEQKLFRDQDRRVQEAMANAIGALPDKEKRIFWEEMAGGTLSRTAEKIGGKAKELENLKWQLQHLGENTRRKGIFARARDRLFRNAGYTEEDLQRIKDDPEEAKKEIEKIDKKILDAKRKEAEERKIAEGKDREINQKPINNLARDPQVALNRSGYPGGSVYAKLAKALGGNIPDYKAASLYLNQYGIKGITYEDMTDGRCFVVFDDKAVAIIDRFNQGATYGQPMFDVGGRGITTLSAFRKRIEEGDAAGEKVNSKKMTDAHGVVYTEERFRHIIKEHHLTDEELDDIGAHINDLYDVRLSAWKKGEYTGQYQGNAVLAKVRGSIGNYEVVLEVRPDGQVFFDTACKVNKKAEETGAEMLSPEGAVSDGRQISSASIQSIRERFAPVNSSEIFSLLK